MASSPYPFGITPEVIVAHRTAVLETAYNNGLTPDNAVIIGGGGLALHGLFTNVPMYRDLRSTLPPPFDLDAIAIMGSTKDKRPAGSVIGLMQRDIIHFPNAPYSATLVRGFKARLFARDMGYQNLDALMADRTEIDDLTTLSVRGLTRFKAESPRPRPKDLAGIIGAHLIAVTLEQGIATDPGWLETVGKVVSYLDRNRPNRPGTGDDPMMPMWLNDLSSSGFDHPAFAGMQLPASVELIA